MPNQNIETQTPPGGDQTPPGGNQTLPDGDQTPSKNSLKSLSLPLVILALLFLAAIVGWYLRNSLKTTPSEITTPPPKVQPLLMGGIAPLTGDAASYGLTIQQAAFLAQKEINQAGGVNGHPIEILWEDGKCENENARAAAEKLVNVKKVEILIAGSCSSEFLAAAPIAQAQGIISLSPSATSPEISNLGKYIFRTAPSDALAGEAAAQYAYKKLKAKTAGIIAENKDYPLSLSAIFKENFTESGGTIVIDETFETGTTEFKGHATKVKELAPDVIYILPQTPTPGVLLVKALKDAGATAQILTAEVLLIRDAIAEQGDVLEGVTGIELLFDETRPKAKSMLSRYKQEYGLDPTYPGYMAGMYDLLYLVKEAYETVGGVPDDVARFLYDLQDWEGTVGILNFDENGDPSFTYSIRLISGHAAPQVDVFTPSGNQ